MMKSILSTVALSALLAGGTLAGAAHAQYAAPTVDTGVSVGSPVGAPGMLIGTPGNTPSGTPAGSAANAMGGSGIGPGMHGGVGAPIDGLDSNPYAEAPQAARALGYPYHPPAKSGAATLN
jgi:hypothetical protein